MTLDSLLEFIAREDDRLQERYYAGNPQLRIHTGTIKIAEEVGELCSEVLAQSNLQRAEKLDSRSDEALGEEFADVLITTLLVAHAMDVDIVQALEKKMEKISMRYAKD